MFGALAGMADRFVEERMERLATTARAQADKLAAQAGDHFARQLVDQLAQRLAATIAVTTVGAGALIVGVWLIVSGFSGALGELFGRAWLGQLVAGAATLLIVAVIAGVVRMLRQSRKDKAAAAEQEAQEAEAAARAEGGETAGDVASELGLQALQAGGAFVRRHPMASAAALTAAGLLAGTLLSKSNGRTDPQR